MQDLRHVIEQFGQAVGLHGLAPGVDGVVRIRLEGGESIGLEIGEQGLVLSQLFPVPFVSGSQLVGALQRADARQRTAPHPLRVGLVGRGAEACLVVSGRLRTAEAEVPQMLQLFAALQGWFERWQSATR